jgi:hypothetical protein
MLPGMSAMPSISAGGGGPSGATSYSGVTTELANPFNFDNSNWQVNIKGSGAQSATSASGSTPASGLNIPLLAMAVVAWLLLK